MNSFSDTLEIKPLRRAADLPMAAVGEAENHPEAAAVARARIAALPETYPLIDPASVPAIPTQQLVTDRATLAQRYRTAIPDVSRRELPGKLRAILIAIGSFALMLLVFKAPVIISQANYTFSKPTPTPVAAPAAEVIPAASSITIPKINVHAPIVFEPSVVEANVQKALEGGVVHYGNTPKPGESGNSVVFGHSSNDWWEPGGYKFVFVLLDKLAPGDRFTVDYRGQRYIYEVTGSKIVEPTDLSVLKPSSEPTMSLITCTPPGTSWKRLVVIGKQVSPDPARTQVAATPSASDSAKPGLPGAAPNFLEQMNQAWSGMWHGVMGLFGADQNQSGSSTETPGTLPAIK